MKKQKKFIKSFVVFLILIAITFYILFRNQDINSIFLIMSGVEKKFIFFSILALIGYVLCEAVNMKRNLKSLGNNICLSNCIKYFLVNAFFSGITPSSTGGQPMEIYYMHKDGIEIPNATIVVLMQSCGFQIATLIFSMIGVWSNAKYMSTALILLFILGFTLNLGILTFYIVAIFSRRISNWAINLIVKALKKFKIKNLEEREGKLRKGLDYYQSKSKYIKENKNVVLKTVAMSFIQIFCFYAITYFIYRAFGFNQYNIFTIVGMQAVVYTSASGIPLPGAVGISEGSFIALFKNIFESGTVTSAMLLSRGINFYFLLICSGLAILINSILIKLKLKKRIDNFEK